VIVQSEDYCQETDVADARGSEPGRLDLIVHYIGRWSFGGTTEFMQIPELEILRLHSERTS